MILFRGLIFLVILFLAAPFSWGNTNKKEQDRPFQIPMPGGGTYQATREEYQRWAAQQQRIRQRQQMQQQAQNQLAQMKNRSGGGGAGSSGADGGGGSKGGNSSKLQPLNPESFGKMPDFSEQNKDLEKLVAESAKPDKESDKLLENLRKKMAEASEKRGSVSLSSDLFSLDAFTSYLNSALASIQARASLLRAAQTASVRPVVGRPSRIPSGLGLVAGQSRVPRKEIPAYRGLASVAPARNPLEDLVPRNFRNRPQSGRRALTH